jgi:hypothetical protein
MASTDIFLCRKNGRFFKYDAVEAVSLTGSIQTYSGVTGVDSTDVVTISGATLSDGLQITFSQLTGGSNLTTGRTYFTRDSSGSTCKLAEYVGGAAVNLGSNITAGNAIVQSDELRVWSAEYRDIFQNTTELHAGTGTNVVGGFPLVTEGTFQASAAAVPTVFTGGGTNSASSFTNPGGLSVRGTTDLLVSVSDEINHQPLRQTFLPRTHWKFDMGSNVSPRYLYAEWQTGDAVTPNPPNTI